MASFDASSQDVGAGDAQRIGGDERARIGDGAAEEIAVGGERGDHAEAAIDVDRRDGGEVAPSHAAGDEVARRLLRFVASDRRREGEVEEQDEVAPRRRDSAATWTVTRLGGEIDGVEVPMALLRPLIEELEVRRRQSAHRIAGAVDDRDRHLDEVNVDRLFDLCGCSARCEQKKERNAAGATHRDDFLPDTERTECPNSPPHSVTGRWRFAGRAWIGDRIPRACLCSSTKRSRRAVPRLEGKEVLVGPNPDTAKVKGVMFGGRKQFLTEIARRDGFAAIIAQAHAAHGQLHEDAAGLELVRVRVADRARSRHLRDAEAKYPNILALIGAASAELGIGKRLQVARQRGAGEVPREPGALPQPVPEVRQRQFEQDAERRTDDLHDYPVYSPIYCASAVGFYLESILRHGGTDPTVVETKCQTLGDQTVRSR